MAGTTQAIDARGWIFEVEDEEAATETWLPLAGLTSFTWNPAENEETAETAAFESDGAYEEDTMQRGASITVEGLRRVLKGSGAQDPGQAYVDGPWTDRVGEGSRNRVRFRHRTQTTAWTVWEATVSPGEQGGDTNSKSTWGATFKRCGWPTTMPVVVIP
ncbi:phage tail tube protein [Streptomyces sp. LE64]|uniref:phage tail tube protein n=1 Tax=Streptomyces sp. LE64 TaxID=3448653 RepID=UPI0040433202